MKYGLLYFRATNNIGDDVQTYAARRFLPQVDCAVDRETMDAPPAGFEEDEPVAVIMNGWYMHHKANWPPAANIEPLWVSMHLTQMGRHGKTINDCMLDSVGGDYLKHHQPIGTRDENTRKILAEKGIDAYVTGCMTLTIDLPPCGEKSGEMLLVDLEEADERAVLAACPQGRFQRVTHIVDAKKRCDMSIGERMQEVEQLLQRYQRAQCVITSRLHCALPCLAMGTPVLLVYQPRSADRFATFLPLVRHCTPEELPEALRSFDPLCPPANGEAHLPVRAALEEACRTFVQETQQGRRKTPFVCEPRAFIRWQQKLRHACDLVQADQLRNQGAAYIRRMKQRPPLHAPAQAHRHGSLRRAIRWIVPVGIMEMYRNRRHP